jgi:hypothetical protein
MVTCRAAKVRSERNEAREPEDHGGALDGGDGIAVGGDGKKDGRADHVGQHQPGPDGAEDEEGYLAKGGVEEIGVELVCDW